MLKSILLTYSRQQLNTIVLWLLNFSNYLFGEKVTAF